MIFLLPSPYTLELCFHSDFFLLDKFVSSAQLNYKLLMRDYITAAMLSLRLALLISFTGRLLCTCHIQSHVGSAGRVNRASAPTSWTYLVISLVSVSSLSSLNQPPELDAFTLYKYKFLQP